MLLTLGATYEARRRDLGVLRSPTTRCSEARGMAMGWLEDEVIRRLLGHETWAVVGLGNNPERPAYGVANFLMR